MGEYADDEIDRWIDGGGNYGYRSSRPRKAVSLKTCNRCGETDLKWVETLEGWRLHEWTGSQWVMHRCGTSRAKPPEDGPPSDEEWYQRTGYR